MANCSCNSDDIMCGLNCRDVLSQMEDCVRATGFMSRSCKTDNARIQAMLLSVQSYLKGVMREMALMQSRDEQLATSLKAAYETLQKVLAPSFVTITFNEGEFAVPATLYGDATSPLMITAAISDLYTDGTEITALKVSTPVAGTAKSVTMFLPDATGNQQKYTASNVTFTDGNATLGTFTGSSEENACPAISGLYLCIVFDTSTLMPTFPTIGA